MPKSLANEHTLDWVIVGALGITYESFTLYCKAVKYACALRTLRGLECTVVHKRDFARQNPSCHT